MTDQQRPLNPHVAALQLVFNAALEHCPQNTVKALSAMAGPSFDAVQTALWIGEDEHKALEIIKAEQAAKASDHA